MNKEQAKQLEENPIWKAFKEGKTIQYCSEWSQSLKTPVDMWKDVEKFDVMRLLSNPEEFRVKPELKEWEQEGWRTRDPEEIIKEGDWLVFKTGHYEKAYGLVGTKLCDRSWYICYTNKPKKQEFPKPPEGEEWNNPENLMAEQVEVKDGWRLVLKSELPPKDHGIRGKVELWDLCCFWDNDCEGDGMYSVYRTKEPLPKPIPEYLKEGWREFVEGETIQEGDWFVGGIDSIKLPKGNIDIGMQPFNLHNFRTNRPLPDSFLVKKLQKELQEKQNLIDLQRTMITEANKKLNEALKLPYEAF